MIPPSSTLRFEVELVSVQLRGDSGSLQLTIRSHRGRRRRSRAPTSRRWRRRKQLRLRTASTASSSGQVDLHLRSLLDQGREAAWYLNLITFPIIFAIVGVGFYLVVALDNVIGARCPSAATTSPTSSERRRRRRTGPATRPSCLFGGAQAAHRAGSAMRSHKQVLRRYGNGCCLRTPIAHSAAVLLMSCADRAGVRCASVRALRRGPGRVCVADVAMPGQVAVCVSPLGGVSSVSGSRLSHGVGRSAPRGRGLAHL